MKYMSKLLFLSILIFGFCLPSLSVETSESPAFLIQTEEKLPTLESPDLLFNYNSSLFDSQLLDKFSKQELMELIRNHSAPKLEKGQAHTGFIVPFGPSVDWSHEINNSVSDLDEIASLTEPKKKKLIEEIKAYRVEFAIESIQAIDRKSVV